MTTVAVGTGRLRHKGEIQSETKSRDAFGGESVSWSKVADVWAEVRPVSAKEMLSGAQITQDVTHVIRFRPLSTDVTPSMRFRWNGRSFNFTQVLNIQERDILVECLAVEDVNGG